MDEYLLDQEELGEEGDLADVLPDPFDGINKRDQDTFFRVLDLIPDEQRSNAIEYFMDHPDKIQAVIAGVKKRKELIANKDIDGIHKLLEEERIQFEQMMATNDDDLNSYPMAV